MNRIEKREAFLKGLKIIRSCTTIQHLEVAKNYVNQYNLLTKETSLDFNTFRLEDSINYRKTLWQPRKIQKI